VWVTGTPPYRATVEAIDQLGGIGRFVKSGQRVALLPNIGWARTMEQGANTHPEVVRALIELCHNAGAKSISVFCNGSNDIRQCLDRSGIGAVIDDSPARFIHISEGGWRERPAVAACGFLKSTRVYREVDEADVIINAPPAKHHGNVPMSMCCKNLLGAIRDRAHLHQSLHEAIADLTLMIPTTLCVLDASRVLMRSGPTGGNPDDVEWRNTIIAGFNPVEIDALGMTFLNLDPREVEYFRIMRGRGVAEIDPAKLPVKRVAV
jgi:uncharacterized protein (DUF362 family)